MESSTSLIQTLSDWIIVSILIKREIWSFYEFFIRNTIINFSDTFKIIYIILVDNSI